MVIVRDIWYHMLGVDDNVVFDNGEAVLMFSVHHSKGLFINFRTEIDMLAFLYLLTYLQMCLELA